MSATSTTNSSGNHGAHKYRPDIDGLRAIAVSVVVLFHAGVKQLGGGYVGVDVFFVISGYLITQFIEHRIKAGEFSILEFYERRVRRIVPALFFLLCAASVVGVFVLLPKELIKFAESQIATVFFMPNLFFYYFGSGYFEAGTKLKPLLHMWSLGVEEQFYIFFPLIMFLGSKFSRQVKLATVCLLSVVSFGLSCWAVQYQGTASEAFYLPAYRAWELLLGALLALGIFRLPKSRYLRELLAALGLGATLVGAFAYSSGTPFPGATAALPCIGAALIIYAGESGPTLVGKALSMPPIVAIGLISYSLYLWHWPVIVFAKELIGRPLTSIEKISAILLSVAAAVLSWKFVEGPFRTRKYGPTRRRLFLQTAAAALCLLLIETLYIGVRGFPQRFPRQAIVYADAGYDTGSDLDVCRSPSEIERQPQCHFGVESESPPDFILWGDSHAKSLAPAFRRLAVDTGARGWIASYRACMPLLDVSRADKPGCPEFNAAVISLIEQKDIKTVVLTGRWSVGSLGLSESEVDEGRPQVLLFDSTTKTRSLAGNSTVFERGLRRVLVRLSEEGRKIILMLDVPDTGVDTPQYLARGLIQGRIPGGAADARIGMSSYGRESERVEHVLLNMADEFHLVTIDPKKQMCEAFQCLIAKDGHSLYRDSHHLSDFGALQLVDLLRPVVPQSALRLKGSSKSKLYSKLPV